MAADTEKGKKKWQECAARADNRAGQSVDEKREEKKKERRQRGSLCDARPVCAWTTSK